MPRRKLHRPVRNGYARTTALILAEESFLRSMAKQRVRQQADVDDLVQETLFRALKARNRFKYGVIRSWLATILIRVHLDQVRSAASRAPRGSEEELEELEAEAEVAVQFASACDEEDLMKMISPELARALAEVPCDHRAAFLLQTLDELSGSQIAELLDISEITARVRIHRARERLKQILSA